jgi:hypothetical protein
LQCLCAAPWTGPKNYLRVGPEGTQPIFSIGCPFNDATPRRRGQDARSMSLHPWRLWPPTLPLLLLSTTRSRQRMRFGILRWQARPPPPFGVQPAPLRNGRRGSCLKGVPTRSLHPRTALNPVRPQLRRRRSLAGLSQSSPCPTYLTYLTYLTYQISRTPGHSTAGLDSRRQARMAPAKSASVH